MARVQLILNRREDDASDFPSVVIEFDEGQHISVFIENYRTFLLAIGFHPDTVTEALGEEV